MERAAGLFVNLISFFSINKALFFVHKFFTTPRKGKLKSTALPLFLQKATSDFFEYRGEKVFVYHWNYKEVSKPLILLIHGWESNSSRWEQMQSYLGHDFRYIAFDAPSLGQSKGKDLNVKNYQEVIDLSIRQFQPHFVIGHSLGAFSLFQQLSCQKYSSVQKVVILGSFDCFEVVVNQYFKLLGYNKRIVNSYQGYLEQLIGKPLSFYSCSTALQKVDVPVLCVHDINDSQVFYDKTISFHQALKEKNSKVITTRDLGHSLQHSSVFKAIEEFFK